MSGIRRFATFLLALSVPGVVSADDWPQFRGTARDGFAPQAALLRGWPEGGPKVRWRAKLGPGFSQVAVSGGRAFVAFSDDTNEYLGAFDATTGRELWRRPLGKTFVQLEFGNGPRGTPTIAGEVAYAFGGTGVLAALKVADGTPLWEVDVTATLGASVPRFGYSGSPLVVDDLVVLDVGAAEGRQLVAFDRTDGKVRWATLDGPAGYSSPIVTTLAGTRQIVHAHGANVTGDRARRKVSVVAQAGRKHRRIPDRRPRGSIVPFGLRRYGLLHAADPQDRR